ncbi:subtilisin-like protease SBT1.7 [Lactuca sativa]|uniref:Subtilisin-like protease n=1 Tax=Lactuca sativa TaxID=4236 RepID=A0A9R1XEU1_LACSA|nr:subtilisin-like protease SBT1.7 [Lactuca sativa]KAJ0211930.1 hypothetical protein LSAT_V11C400207410 [Lactuca sativa]
MNPRIILLMAVMVVVCHPYTATNTNQEQKTYIVHMDKAVMPPEYSDHQNWYATSMESVSESPEMLYTYENVIHGFSTRLTVEQAKLLEKKHGVLSVKEEVIYKLHTTRSPEFLGLAGKEMIFSGLNSSSDVVIGVVDTGVWPGSKSLDDTGFGPVPGWWKGECKKGTSFGVSNCNKKLIGATFFSRAYEATYGPIDETIESRSAIDDDGHGTHTATTAAGSIVTGASLFGFAKGKARGMAPNARLAVYKACWLGGCLGSDILAAIEKAIADRVHVLSLSIGGTLANYTTDMVAYGTFKAVSRGIFVACSAGNSGPDPFSLSNVAPWIATVGAGTIDRDFPASVVLGNGKMFRGVSLYSGKPLSKFMVPIVYAGNISKTTGNFCLPGTLPRRRVAGKIVMCERGGNSRVQKGMVVKEAGGVGMIVVNSEKFGEELVADAQLIPTATIGYRGGEAIKRYILSNDNPTATIASGVTELHIQPSPVVAAFSSRGPNPLTPEILKPDFIAPGVNILAGWTGKTGPSGLTEDTRRVKFNIVSGTSMSCPHVSGLAALLKATHPTWTPAAIRSALMTTAYNVYKNGEGLKDIATENPSTPFDHGSGHVDPVRAMDPGLVYDASANDYLGFLCALNYSSNAIKMFGGGSFKCRKKYRVEDLNYPSFAVHLRTGSDQGGPTTVKYTRTLKNVGSPATYKVSVWSKIASVKIKVDPEELIFTKQGEKRVYTVTFTASPMQSGTTGFGQLKWYGGKYVVSSPIAFSWV